MLSALVFGVLLAGASAQLEAVQTGAICRGLTVDIEYVYCGYIPNAQLNVYWTYVMDMQQVNILFEGQNTGWLAFGFGGNEIEGAPMTGGRVAFGCHDIDGQPDVVDTLLNNRSGPGVEGGFGMGGQNFGMATENIVDGVCGIRIERPAMILEGGPQQNVVMGTPNLMIAARGPDALLSRHDVNARTAAQIDFIAGTAMGLMEVQDLVGPDVTTPMPGPDMTMPPGDNSAAALSLSSVVVAGVASVLAAL